MTLGITMGDPAGVGPEIILKSLAADPTLRRDCVIFGARCILDHYNEAFQYGLTIESISHAGEGDPDALRIIEPTLSIKRENPSTSDAHLTLSDFTIGSVSPVCGALAFRALEAAVKAAQTGEIDAIITAPLNKEAMNLAGHHYDGHTGALAHLTNTPRCAMLLWSEQIKVIHVTTHLSMRRACDLIKTPRVVQTIELAHETLRRAGYETPRIAVAGLNAHAGENGLFGEEEILEIIPAVEQCRKAGLCVEGPIAPDTVFLKCKNGGYDVVVAMYHDQGHIPLKLLDFQGGVNISVGLPIIRTSVDHGTAFDIAGKGIASTASLLEAIKVARLLTASH